MSSGKDTLDRDLVEAAYAGAPVGLAVFDAELRFVWVNRALAEINGMPAEEHLGQRLDEALPDLPREVVALARTVLDTGAPAERHGISAMPGERERSFSVVYFPVEVEGARGLACVVGDETEAVLNRRRLDGLQELTTLLAQPLTRDRVTSIALDRGRRLVGAAEAAAALVVPGGAELETIGMAGFDEEIERGWQRIPFAPSTPMSDAVVTGMPVILESAEDRARLYPHLPNVTNLTIGAVPLRSDERVTGSIAFRFPDSRQLSAEERALMVTVGELFGAALERARLYEDERRTRLELEETLIDLRRVYRVTDTAIAHLSLPDLLRELLRRVTEELGVDRAVALLLEDGVLRVRAAYGLEEEIAASVAVPFGKGFAGTLAARNEPRIIDDTAEIETVSPYLKERTRSLMGVPLTVGGRVIGVLHAGTSTPRHFTPRELDLLRRAGDRAAIVIRNAQLYEAAEAERRRLETLMDQLPVGVAIAEAPSGAVVAVNRRASEIWRVPAAPREPITDVTPYVAYHLDGRRVEPGEWPLARALATGQDVEAELVEAEFGDGTRGYVSLSATPIRDEAGAVIGAVTTLVDMTEARRREEAARFLAEASELLAEPLDAEEALRRLAELAVPRIADWCSVTIRRGRSLDTVAVAHSDPAKRQRAWEFEQRYAPADRPGSAVVRAMESRRSILVPEVTPEAIEATSPDREFTDALLELGLRSVIIAPLTARGRTLGALTLVNAESPRRFTQDDAEFAEELARHAALAVDNARLYQDQSALAETLQRSLLPPRLPVLEGFRVGAAYVPGGEGIDVGGDFYDLFPAGDDRFGFAVGDVCGKGAAAAALTALARHTIRASVLRGDGAEGTAHAVNGAIRAELGDELRFLTAAIGALERRGSGWAFELACAGHPPPVLRHADGSASLVASQGTLLGVFDDPRVNPVDGALEPGDALVLYTDGVSESWRQAPPGELHVAELVAARGEADPDALAAAIVEAARAAHPEGQHDDMAVLVLQRDS